MKNITLKNQLRSLLEKHHITAAHLSRETGVSKAVLSLWLNGASPKKIEQVKAVSDYFSISLDQLLYGENVAAQTSREKPLENIVGEWMSGVFEIKVRKLPKN